MRFALALDPADLPIPAGDDLSTWLARVQALSELVAEQAIAGSVPPLGAASIHEAFADWDALNERLARAGVNLRADELLRIVDPFLGRLARSPLEHHEAVISAVRTAPPYTAPVDAPTSAEWHDHLGCLAVQKALSPRPAAVVSRGSNWSDDSVHIQVEATVDLLFDGFGEEDDQFSETGVREYLARVETITDVYTLLCEHPGLLIAHPALGALATWHGKLHETDPIGDFRLGPNFERSLQVMNYANDHRRAGACLRAMAIVAGGRGASLPGHAERDGAGGNNPVLRQGGHVVQRTYLAQNSPDAHRMFWIDAPTPVFLNVGGHEAAPSL
jgi:hypothetical protein